MCAAASPSAARAAGGGVGFAAQPCLATTGVQESQDGNAPSLRKDRIPMADTHIPHTGVKARVLTTAAWSTEMFPHWIVLWIYLSFFPIRRFARIVLKSIRAQEEVLEVQRWGCASLRELARESEDRAWLGRLGGIELVLHAMRSFQADTELQQSLGFKDLKTCFEKACIDCVDMSFFRDHKHMSF